MTGRGLLDWPGVLFAWINDGLLLVLPEPLGLAVWSLVSAWATMWVYRRFSNQDKLAELKPRIKDVQSRLARYDGDFSGLTPLILENLSLSGRHVLLVLGPALLAGVPVLLVLVWISNAYGVKFPEPGEATRIEILSGPGINVEDWNWRGIEAARAEQGVVSGTESGMIAWVISWPADTATLEASSGRTLLELPPPAPSHILHQRRWWNALIGNPGGYLDADSPLRIVRIELPGRQMLPFGPAWMRGWAFLYFVLLIAGSLGLKFYWRIH